MRELENGTPVGTYGPMVTAQSPLHSQPGRDWESMLPMLQKEHDRAPDKKT